MMGFVLRADLLAGLWILMVSPIVLGQAPDPSSAPEASVAPASASPAVDAPAAETPAPEPPAATPAPEPDAPETPSSPETEDSVNETSTAVHENLNQTEEEVLLAIANLSAPSPGDQEEAAAGPVDGVASFGSDSASLPCDSLHLPPAPQGRGGRLPMSGDDATNAAFGPGPIPEGQNVGASGPSANFGVSGGPTWAPFGSLVFAAAIGLGAGALGSRWRPSDPRAPRQTRVPLSRNEGSAPSSPHRPSPQQLGALRRKVREHPADPRALFDLGIALLRAGSQEGGVRRLDVAFRRDPALVVVLLKDPSLAPLLKRPEVVRTLRRFQRDQLTTVWAGYA